MTLIPFREGNPVPPPSSWIVSGFDVRAALRAGGGVFVVDDSTQGALVTALESFPGVYRADEKGPTAQSLDVSSSSFGLIDLIGHSIAAGGGVSALNIQDGFAPTLGRLLDVQRFRDLAIGGSIACWSGADVTSGVGGWGWVAGGQVYHGVAAGEAGWVGPYMPRRHGAIIMATENDLGELGSNKPLPMQSALRSLISWACTAAFIDDTDASWVYGGSGWAPSSVGGFGNGPGASYHFTPTLNDFATLSVPSSFPGQVLALDLFLNPTHDLTVGVTIDGVAQPDVRLQGSVLCDTEVGGKYNAICLRFTRLAAGAHTVVLTLKTQTVAGSQLLLNSARVESDPLDGPVVIVPSCIKPAGSDYSLWSSAPHGPNAGTNPMNNAGVETWKVAEQAVVAEFGPNLLYVDVDNPLGQNAAYFIGDHIHPNEVGHAIIGETVYAALRTSGVLTMRRRTRPAPTPVAAFTRVVGSQAGGAFVNGWGLLTSKPALAYYLDTQGNVHIQGQIGGGTANNVATIGLGYRPQYDTEFVGISNGNLIQRWRLTAAGILSIEVNRDATRSILPPQTYAPTT